MSKSLPHHHSSHAFEKEIIQSRRRSAACKLSRRFQSTLALLLLFVAVFLVLVSPKRITVGHAQRKTEPSPTRVCECRKPRLPDNPLGTYFPASSQIAVVTRQSGLGQPVLIVDLNNQNQAGVPVDKNWDAISNPPTHFYTHPAWTKNALGDVFGLTLDDAGNIYVTASSSYVGATVSVGGTGGEVYRIDGTTGAVNKFAVLPNLVVNNQAPALGNIHYSCQHDSFYVSNFADGRIYHLKNATTTTGVVKSTFDHYNNVIDASSTAGGFEGGRNYNQFVPRNSVDPNNPNSTRGERVWGVQVFEDRLYYGVWRQDSLNNTGVDNHPNEIWSIPLLAGGIFTGSAQLELTLPPLSATNPWPNTGATNFYSNPVSDISFHPSGKMLLAERSMSGDTGFAAHKSRVLEYTRPNSSSPWTPLTVTAANKYGIGAPHPATSPTNNGGRPSAAGGVDYDLVGSRVWATGDALHFNGFPYPPDDIGHPAQSDYIYGIQGLDLATGGTIHNSILIDVTGSIAQAEKHQIGDVEVVCVSQPPVPTSCVKAETREISCRREGGANYVHTFILTNNTGETVTSVLLAPASGSNITLSPPMPPLPAGGLPPNGQLSVQVGITGGQPGSQACFTITLMTEKGECCTTTLCVTLPSCCATFNPDSSKLECNADGTYTYTTSITNNTTSTIENIFVYAPSGVTMTPNYFDVSVAPGSPEQIKIVIKGAQPGEFCFEVSLHTADMKACCKVRFCIKLPECRR